jgi:competence protein ComEA
MLVLVSALVLVLAVAGAALAAPAAPAPAAATTVSATATVGGKVNVNTADVKALMRLSGVGRRVAEKIVEYRQAHGPFKTVEDLRKVDGVGPALVDKNRERLAVR